MQNKKENNHMQQAKYIENVITTESRISDKTEYDTEKLKKVLQLFVLSSEVLDQVKREIFYGKSDVEKYNKLLSELLSTHTSLLNHEASIKPIEANPRLMHGVIGLGTEAGELSSMLLDHLNGEPLDAVNMGEELGDCSWYEAILLDEYKLNKGKILSKNIKKLKARYKYKFDAARAIKRDLVKERQILEK